ncbi:MAG: nitrite reductase large subunit, partial [Pseudonocardiales bacterium]|nr:nitrite reductase large subunit [Pseudonocardiales bacterium]
MTDSAPNTLVVIGNGMVGHRLVEILRDSSWRIVVFGEEDRPAY